MLLNLVGSSAFWLGNGPVIVTFDAQDTLVERLEGELDYLGVYPGHMAFYGSVKQMNESGDIVIHFCSPLGDENGQVSSDNEYDFHVPKGMYIVVMRRR